MKNLTLPITTKITFIFLPIFIMLFLGVKIIFAQNCQPSSLHQGLISALSVGSGSIGNIDQTCILNNPQATFRNFNVPSFTDLENQFYTLSRSPAKKTEQLQNNNLPIFSGDGIYDQNSSLTISTLPSAGSGTQVIFIKGDLTITGNIDYGETDPYSGLVFITSGDINISSAVTKINAVLVSFGKICTAYNTSVGSCLDGETPTPQLIINGSLISLNKAPLGESAIKLTRNLSNNIEPAEKINKQAKYLYVLSNLLTNDLILTREDNSYPINYTPPPSPSGSPGSGSGVCDFGNPLVIPNILTITNCLVTI